MGLSGWHALHFLRPVWLLAGPPLLLLALWGARRSHHGGNWAQVVDADLLPALVLQPSGRSHSPWWLFGAAWLLAVLALAGPSWQRRESAAFRMPPAWVIVLDLSPSMAATDLTPDRVTRAHYAIDDILSAARDARIGLVAFASEPYVVVPLTSDVATVRNLLQPLTPEIMPAPGDQLAPALNVADQMLQSDAGQRGHVVVLSDGISDSAQALLAVRRLRQHGDRVDVVGIGTTPGAPQPDGHGGFAHDATGQLVVTRLQSGQLQRIATAGNGRYVPLNRVAGLISTLQADHSNSVDAAARASPQRVTTWLDGGIWLLVPLLAVAALLARRGWV